MFTNEMDLYLVVGGAAAAALLFVLTYIGVQKSRKPPKASQPSAEPSTVKAQEAPSWIASIHEGLSKTRSALLSNLEPLFSRKQPLSAETLDHLHEVLFRADIGVGTADKLVSYVKTTCKKEGEYGWEEIKTLLQGKIAEIIAQQEGELPISYPEKGPLVILVIGVNGVGKTTSIGKLAAYFQAQNKRVLLCAADTFRAAAIDQLKVWGERLGVETIAQQPGADPAAVAFDGVQAAVARNYDVVLVDTAGRLHSKNNLMAELEKIKRVMGKALPQAPHETWLIVDATTGQNAVQQVKAFREVAQITGLIVTKLDGTAKGGILIGICDQFSIPIRFIGVGEKTADLRPFVPEEFAEGIFS